MKNEKSNYLKKLQLNFIIVIMALVLLFWAFPKFKHLPKPLPHLKIENINVVQIPRTIQKRKAAPPPLKPSIPVPGDEMEILEEVPIEISENISITGQTSGDIPLSEDELPYAPRQIIEALPRVNDLKISGKIVVKLLIDKNGRMKKYEILFNSTGSSVAEKRVLEAVCKSRWESIQLNQTKVEYWITKVYQFR